MSRVILSVLINLTITISLTITTPRSLYKNTKFTPIHLIVHFQVLQIKMHFSQLNKSAE
jgi:hypothetical protein